MTWPTRASDAKKPRLLIPFGDGVAVSEETELLELTEWGVFYSDVVFTLRNLSETRRAVLYVDQSESGYVTDEDRRIVTVDPLKERRVEFRDILSLWWGCSASGDPDDEYAEALVSLQVVCRQRLR